MGMTYNEHVLHTIEASDGNYFAMGYANARAIARRSHPGSTVRPSTHDEQTRHADIMARATLAALDDLASDRV